MAVLLSSNRDRVKLQEGGYLYVFDKLSSNGEKKFWRCERKSECNARIHTDSVTNEIIKRTSEHNHPCSLDSVQSCALRTAIKRRAAEEAFAVPTVEQLNATEGGIDAASKGDPLRKLFHRAKNKALPFVANAFSPSISASAGTLADGTLGFGERCGVWPSSDAVGNGLLYPSAELMAAGADAVAKVLSVKEELANDASANVEITTAASLPRDSHPKRYCWKQNVAATSGVEKYLTGGLVIWSSTISSIIEQAELIVNMVCQGEGRGFASLLFSGPASTGKSCLAALTAKSSDIPTVRLYGTDDMLGLSESSKVLSMRNIFDDAHSSALSVVMLDSIERLIDYCPVGDRYSNMVLQTLMILLKKFPPPNHRLLILGTASERCTREFGLDSLFNYAIEVPPLNEVEHLMAVVEDSNIFDASQCGEIREQLSTISNRYSIGIKKLLDILELVKHCGSSQQISFLCESLQHMISE